MNNFDLITRIIVLIIYLSLSFVYLKHALMIFQQNRYEIKRYYQWLTTKNNYHFSIALIFIPLSIIISLVFKHQLLDIALVIIMAIYLIYQENKKDYIKELKITARIKRQIVVLVLLEIFILNLSIKYCPLVVVNTLAICLPYLLIFAVGIITEPIEVLIRKYYENDAKKILDSMPNLIKIGITGSYGKTSTKNIINDLLKTDFYTLITPSSFNTPMGITRTIREYLKPIHEVFVVEMGADKVNDITYLMNFVKPKYGVVSSIGPQHLATFTTQENIINEKMQEVEMLSSDGVAFINIDNEYINNYQIKNNCKIVSVGIKNEAADYFAYNIKYSNSGSKFSCRINSKVYHFETFLLGEHNITNILLAIALAYEMGIDLDTIKENVKNIKQVEHRLEVKKINNYTFIDDAFNSNPVGSKMALDVLKTMSNKRIIVTPGMIDLGEKQDQINKEFGEYMLDKVDFVILVGEKQTKMILEGLNEVGFDKEKILIVRNVKEAFSYVYQNFSPKDVILLENDLPDAFNV